MSTRHDMSGFDRGAPAPNDWLKQRALTNESRSGAAISCDGERAQQKKAGSNQYVYVASRPSSMLLLLKIFCRKQDGESYRPGRRLKGRWKS